MQQAQLWQRLGVTVTVVEALPRLAPSEEPELSAVIEEVFAREGITVATNADVVHVARTGGDCTLLLAGADGQPTELRAEELLVATGRKPVTDALNLDAVGVKTGPGGEVVADEHLRTGNPRIWAAGDVTG